LFIKTIKLLELKVSNCFYIHGYCPSTIPISLAAQYNIPVFSVRPLKMDLDGVVGHVVQGTKILLQCTVQAARPAANVTWKNGTHFLNEKNERFEMFETKIQENVSAI